MNSNDIPENKKGVSDEDPLCAFYDRAKELTPKDLSDITDDQEIANLPSSNYTGILQYNNMLSSILESLVPGDITDADAQTMMYNGNHAITTLEDVGYRKSTKKLTNKPKYEDKELQLKNLKPKGKVDNKTLAKFAVQQAFGVGIPSNVPLWHSGFWISIRPFTNNEIVRLEYQLVERIGKIGKMTSSLIFSNYSVLFAKVIMDALKPKIITQTLKLGAEDDIYDYIKIQDIYPICWGILKAIYPHGFNYVIPCKNTIKLNSDGSHVCNYKAEIKLNFEELLVVDFDKLTNDQFKLMVNQRSKTVSIEEVMLYQESVDYNEEDEITVQTETNTVTYTLASPSVNRYLIYGSYFIDLLMKHVNDIMGHKENDEAEEEARSVILRSIYLSVYNSYIKSVSVGNVIMDDVVDISESLTDISSDTAMTKEFRKKLLAYIDRSLISIVGVPTYTCPSCKEKQQGYEKGSGFEEYIPLSVYEYFFILLTFRYKKILTKLT